MTKQAKIKVLCVDDSPDLARMIELRLGAEPDMTSVGRLESADDLLATCARATPDVVLIDLSMPGKPTLEAVAELAAAQPQARCIVFSGYDGPDNVDEAAKAGAWGYLSKHGEPDAVVDAVRRVAAGEVVLPGG